MSARRIEAATWDEGVLRSAEDYIATAGAEQVESKGQRKVKDDRMLHNRREVFGFRTQDLAFKADFGARTILELTGL
jgi:hypothetical protein